MNYTYILKLKNGNLYCGWTNDLEKRVAAHNAGTRAQRPVELVWYRQSDTKEEAMSLEAKIKKLSRKDKLSLISGELEIKTERQK